ncbi:MAG: helix-turn-helix domain-containing protein [Clostridia bacterium]|nr:helix-turn-helix domain-containing protein [Clostridia bacterium]
MTIRSRHLPGDSKDRINELMKMKGVNQQDLSLAVGIDKSTLSRIISGNISNIKTDYICRIADYFGVTVEFLLGRTDIPDRKNYEIEKLGISCEAARKLFSGDVDPEILSRIIECGNSAVLFKRISNFVNGLDTNPQEAVNNMMDNYTRMVQHSGEDRNVTRKTMIEIQALKQDSTDAQLRDINSELKSILMSVRKDIRAHAEKKETADGDYVNQLLGTTDADTQKILAEIKTPEDVCTLIINSIGMSLMLTEDEKSALFNAFLPIYKKKMVGENVA